MPGLDRVLLAVLVVTTALDARDSPNKHAALAAADADNRCFLDGGGSTESFFIKESLPVGSLIGTLRLIGEVGTDIELKLNADNSPISIEPGTKNVLLTRPLDKEGVSGAASVSAEVVCERLHTDDPGFPIPVQIRVTDVNDNAPEFVGAPYSLNISELTIVGSTVFESVRAVDRDQPGPFSTVEYSIAKSRYDSYVAFANPLEGTLVLTKQLDYESLKSFEVQIIARDQGSPPRESEATLAVHVQDADDQNPAFFYERYDALLPAGKTEGQKLMVQPQDLRAFDKDVGMGSPVYYAFSGHADEHKYFELNRNTGHIYIRADVPDSEFLQPVTLVVKATQFDNADRYAVTTLTVSKGGIYDSDLQFLQTHYDVRVLENAPLNSVVATLLTNRPSDRRVHFEIEAGSLPGAEFSVSQKGDLVLRKMLDFERQEAYAFRVFVTDGRRNDSADVNITLLNINDWDPRFKYPQYEFFVARQDAFYGFVVGKLEVYDGDKGDKVSLDIKGPYARAFRINKRGELSLGDLKYLNSSEAHIVVVAEDSGIPPRRASVPVVIKFAGDIDGSSFLSAALDSSLVLIIFGVVLLVFFVVILSLSAYICKNRKHQQRRRRLGHALANGTDSMSAKALSHYALHPDAPDQHHRRSNGVNNPMFQRSSGPADLVALNTSTGSRADSASSRRSSSETLSSDPSGPTVQQAQQHHQHQAAAATALNPLNPRSNSQRYVKNGHSKASSGASPIGTTVLVPPPPPTPSIHSSGLPELQRAASRFSSSGAGVVSGHPMPTPRPSAAAGAGACSTASINSVTTCSLAGSELSLQQALRENILTASSRDLTRIQWPRNSIPRRVKKLSWEDEYELSRDRDISTLTDPNVSVTTLNPNGFGEPHIGQALYF